MKNGGVQIKKYGVKVNDTVTVKIEMIAHALRSALKQQFHVTNILVVFALFSTRFKGAWIKSFNEDRLSRLKFLTRPTPIALCLDFTILVLSLSLSLSLCTVFYLFLSPKGASSFLSSMVVGFAEALPFGFQKPQSNLKKPSLLGLCNLYGSLSFCHFPNLFAI
ncbi:unnamed protein product [Citrullus colocynthis]|uniref:Uncharacterized protein n=1 Tax=Citrullus colocynthis TaxID=252529 RepID=A0ABP0YM63_9ROSI